MSAVVEQRTAAMQRAGALKREGVLLRNELRSLPSSREASARIADLLEQRDERGERMKLSMLLSAARGVGPTTIRHWLITAKVPFAEMPVHKLTDQERDRLVDALRGGRPRYGRALDRPVNNEHHDAQIKAVAGELEQVLPPAFPHHRFAERLLKTARQAVPGLVGEA